MAPKEAKIGQTESQIISENLRVLFKNNNKTEAEVAQDLKCPVMTIRRLLSGETTDPRVFTLKTIANYFKVTVDDLIKDRKTAIIDLIAKNKPAFVPILDWATLEKIQHIKHINLNEWKNWHPISLGQNNTLSEHAFALESRPSMYPRFQQGTIFIIDPDVTPSDGDVILVRIRKNNELTLRELSIDPPQWQLHPVVSGSVALHYSTKQHEIVGVVLLTLLYNKKIYG